MLQNCLAVRQKNSNLKKSLTDDIYFQTKLLVFSQPNCTFPLYCGAWKFNTSTE